MSHSLTCQDNKARQVLLDDSQKAENLGKEQGSTSVPKPDQKHKSAAVSPEERPEIILYQLCVPLLDLSHEHLDCRNETGHVTREMRAGKSGTMQHQNPKPFCASDREVPLAQLIRLLRIHLSRRQDAKGELGKGVN